MQNIINFFSKEVSIMSHLIENKAKHLIIIPLNSGKNLYLAPGESSCSIEDFEINGNQKIQKLLKINLIVLKKLN